MPAQYFKAGDYVEYNSLGNMDKTLRGIVHVVGWLGAEAQRGRQVAFVCHACGGTSVLVSIDRLSHGNGLPPLAERGSAA